MKTKFVKGGKTKFVKDGQQIRRRRGPSSFNDTFLNILRTYPSYDENGVFMPIKIDFIGITVTFRTEIRKRFIAYILETEYWKLDWTIGLETIVTTDDVERFENDMCLIKMALS